MNSTDPEALVINAAITGTVLNKSDNSNLPVTVNEIVDCACRVREAGASIIHLHARGVDQSPSYDAELYSEIVEKIRKKTDLIICVSLSGRFTPNLEDRTAALAAKPDLASLTPGSMNFATQPSVNSPDTILKLAERIYEAGAVPEIEIFEAGFVNYVSFLGRKGHLKPPYYFNIILGSLGAAPLDLLGLGHITTLLPPDSTWSVGGLGQFQIDANVMALAAGGHVRVGLEDSVYFDRARKVFADNHVLVKRIADISRAMDRRVAEPAEARLIIGLAQRS